MDSSFDLDFLIPDYPPIEELEQLPGFYDNPNTQAAIWHEPLSLGQSCLNEYEGKCHRQNGPNSDNLCNDSFQPFVPEECYDSDNALPASDRFLLNPTSICMDEDGTTVSHQDVVTQAPNPLPHGKKRTCRTNITPEMKQFLNLQYQLNNYPNSRELKHIASTIGLELKKVRTWFNNTRARDPELSRNNTQKACSRDNKQYKTQLTRANLDAVSISSAESAGSTTSLERYLDEPEDDGAITMNAVQNSNYLPDVQGLFDGYCTEAEVGIHGDPIDSVMQDSSNYDLSPEDAFNTNDVSADDKSEISVAPSVTSWKSKDSGRSRASRMTKSSTASRSTRFSHRTSNTAWSHLSASTSWTSFQQESRRGKRKSSAQLSSGRSTSWSSLRTDRILTELEAVRAAGEPPPMAIPKTPTVKYWCVFCGKPQKNRYEWKRHEETIHAVQIVWKCQSDRYEYTSRQPCIYCGDANPDIFHMMDHRHYDCCLDRKDSQRTFARRDHLIQHLHQAHDGVTDAALKDITMQSGWTVPAPKLVLGDPRLFCGFCLKDFDTWHQRTSHVATHFKDGTAVDWIWPPHAEERAVVTDNWHPPQERLPALPSTIDEEKPSVFEGSGIIEVYRCRYCRETFPNRADHLDCQSWSCTYLSSPEYAFYEPMDCKFGDRPHCSYCGICKPTFQTGDKAILEHHLHKKHQSGACEGKIYSSKSDFLRHLETEHKFAYDPGRSAVERITPFHVTRKPIFEILRVDDTTVVAALESDQQPHLPDYGTVGEALSSAKAITVPVNQALTSHALRSIVNREKMKRFGMKMVRKKSVKETGQGTKGVES